MDNELVPAKPPAVRDFSCLVKLSTILFFDPLLVMLWTHAE